MRLGVPPPLLAVATLARDWELFENQEYQAFHRMASGDLIVYTLWDPWGKDSSDPSVVVPSAVAVWAQTAGWSSWEKEPLPRFWDVMAHLLAVAPYAPYGPLWDPSAIREVVQDPAGAVLSLYVMES